MANNLDIGGRQTGGRDIGARQSPAAPPPSDQTLTGSAGITSAETFGSGGAVLAEQTLTGSAGIPSAETFGSGGVVTGPVSGSAGIPSAETFGSGGSVTGPVVGSTGIPSAEAFGTVTGYVAQNVGFGSSGIPSAETFGSGGIIGWGIVGNYGIPSEEAFGLGASVLQPPTSGNSKFLTFIGNTNRSGYIQTGITVSRSLNFSATAQLNVWDDGEAFVPVTGQEILLWYWTGTAWFKYFAGYLNSVILTKPAGTTGETGKRAFQVNCIDYGKALQRRVVNEKFPKAQYGTINSILAKLATSYLNPEGISVELGTDPGIVVPDTEFALVQLNSVLDQLAALMDGNWQVNWDRVLKLTANEVGPSAPFSITDTSENGRIFSLTEDLGLYRNVQYVKASISQQAPQVTKAYTIPTADNPLAGDAYYVQANGIVVIDSEWAGRVVDILNVQVNGFTIPFVKYGGPYDTGGTLTSAGYYIGQAQPKSIELIWNLSAWALGLTPADGHWGSIATPDLPSPGDIITITFTIAADQPNLILIENTAQIAARQAIEGGTGRHENVLVVANISDVTALQLVGQKSLDRFSVPGIELDYETDDFGLEPNMVQTVTLAKFGLSAAALAVESITSTETDELFLRSRVKVSNSIQQRDAQSAINRLIKRLQARDKTSFWPIIFSLAETIPGLTNPGLITGTNLTPEYTLTKPITLQEVDVKFKTPPNGASALINIMANGVSIFTAPMEYKSVGGVQKFVNFHDAPLTLGQGTQITVDVTQVGSIQPGKDVTVTILGSVGA